MDPKTKRYPDEDERIEPDLPPFHLCGGLGRPYRFNAEPLQYPPDTELPAPDSKTVWLKADQLREAHIPPMHVCGGVPEPYLINAAPLEFPANATQPETSGCLTVETPGPNGDTEQIHFILMSREAFLEMRDRDPTQRPTDDRQEDATI